MSIATYIVLSIAFGVTAMLLMRRCAETTPVKLTKGLAIMFVTATIYVLLFILGITLGDLLRIEGADAPQLYARTNAYIFLGLAIFVALRMLLPHLKRKPQLPVFDLRNWCSVIAMSVASGINVLLIGLGLGFVMPIAGHVHWAKPCCCRLHICFFPCWERCCLWNFSRQDIWFRGSIPPSGSADFSAGIRTRKSIFMCSALT